MLGNLSAAQSISLLEENITGRLGCTDGNEVYVVPVSYVYNNGLIVAHSQPGKKIEMMRKHPSVCLEVDTITDLCNWQSVIATGVYEELTEDQEKYEAMNTLVQHMMKMKVSETARPPHITAGRVHPRQPGQIEMVVFRVRLLEITGRFEKN
jgi:hypothetical protein